MNNNIPPEELVRYFVFPHGLSEEEKAAVDAETRALRLQQLKNMTDGQRLLGEVVQESEKVTNSLRFDQ